MGEVKRGRQSNESNTITATPSQFAPMETRVPQLQEEGANSFGKSWKNLMSVFVSKCNVLLKVS